MSLRCSHSTVRRVESFEADPHWRIFQLNIHLLHTCRRTAKYLQIMGGWAETTTEAHIDFTTSLPHLSLHLSPTTLPPTLYPVKGHSFKGGKSHFACVKSKLSFLGLIIFSPVTIQYVGQLVCHLDYTKTTEQVEGGVTGLGRTN